MKNTGNNTVLDFAIIGAGIAGLTAAKDIDALGYSSAVFEKARGTGGRLSSKRAINTNGQAMAFDLGCSSISARSEGFAHQLDSWHLKGIVAPWCTDEQDKTHYVGVSRNSALTRHLSNGLTCHFAMRISGLEKKAGLWHLLADTDGGTEVIAQARNVVISAPPAQAYDLLPSNSALKPILEHVNVAAQWVMAVEVEYLASEIAAMEYPESDIIHAISHESTKPERDQREGHCILQIQATAQWSEQHLEQPSDVIHDLLLQELERILDETLKVTHHHVHRWLYSYITKGLQNREAYLWDPEGLGLIGDYISAEFEGIESSWMSGKQLASWLTLSNQLAYS